MGEGDIMSSILERKTVKSGDILMQPGETHYKAYKIQSGELRSFVHDGPDKVEIERLGPGSIVGHTNLLDENENVLSYEATVDTTLIILDQNDFRRMLSQSDDLIKTAMNALLQKVYDMEIEKIGMITDEKQVDDKAYEIVSHLLRDMAGERRDRYEDILLPHFNIMCRALEDLKKEERHKKQREHLQETLEDIHKDGEDEVCEDLGRR